MAELESTESTLNLLSSQFSSSAHEHQSIAADSAEESGLYEAPKAHQTQSQSKNTRTGGNSNTNMSGTSINGVIGGSMSSQQHQQQQQQQGETSVWKQSSHPVALFCLFLFRCLAIATYLLCGFFTKSYVFSTVLVVLLLSADFWTVRNVSGRVLVGLRFWNQVDEDGTSYWVFESRDPSQPINAVDAKMFWMAMYTFPIAWIFLFFIGILKFNISFIPIVILALVFNFANTVGFTYAVSTSFTFTFTLLSFSLLVLRALQSLGPGRKTKMGFWFVSIKYAR